MAERETWMLLKVDLQCPSCYKKVKKILCKFPQIRDQVYNKQKNEVRITVVCCSPEKIRDKLCCKGRKVIQSIDIIEPDKKKEPEKPKDQPPQKPADKPKEPEKPKVKIVEPEKPSKADKPKDPEKPPKADKPKEAEKPKPPPEKPKPPPEKPADKPKDQPKPAAEPPKKPEPSPAPPKTPEPAPVPVLPPPPAPIVPRPVDSCPVPVGFCCPQCYDGYIGGPCYHGYGRPPPPPPPCYDTYYYGYGKGCYVSRCDYFSEENTSGCRIM